MTLAEQFRTPPERARVKASKENASREPTSKWVIFGWIISFVGSILWLYGYFEFGNPSVIDWCSMVPLLVAQFLRSIECEAGMSCALTGMLLISWPHLR